ncbi:hypothetical protein EGW08_012078, partial [Elysia chlorotica]
SAREDTPRRPGIKTPTIALSLVRAAQNLAVRKASSETLPRAVKQKAKNKSEEFVCAEGHSHYSNSPDNKLDLFEHELSLVEKSEKFTTVPSRSVRGEFKLPLIRHSLKVSAIQGIVLLFDSPIKKDIGHLIKPQPSHNDVTNLFHPLSAGHHLQGSGLNVDDVPSTGNGCPTNASEDAFFSPTTSLPSATAAATATISSAATTAATAGTTAAGV